MHELALAEQIRNAVIEAAAAYPDKHVTGVTLTVGQLRAIEPDTMEICWQAVTEETPVEGAGLEIQEVRAAGHCRNCTRRFEAEDLIFVCPECGSGDVVTVRGKELLVEAY